MGYLFNSFGSPDAGRLSQVISQATGPAFILGAVAGFVSILMGRMNVVVDRIRHLNDISDAIPLITASEMVVAEQFSSLTTARKLRSDKKFARGVGRAKGEPGYAILVNRRMLGACRLQRDEWTTRRGHAAERTATPCAGAGAVLSGVRSTKQPIGSNNSDPCEPMPGAYLRDSGRIGFAGITVSPFVPAGARDVGTTFSAHFLGSKPE
jgi:hypothetical protein